MPISCPFPVRSIGQEEFTRLDYQVMRLAYDSQNALGRLGDEGIYQNDLAARITASGLAQVRQEVPITVSHRDFVKVYRLDLVINDSSEKVVRMLPLSRDGFSLGNQRFHLLSDQVAFRLTAMSGETDDYESQLKSLLRHSPLSAIQWINMARHKIQFVTIKA